MHHKRKNEKPQLSFYIFPAVVFLLALSVIFFFRLGQSRIWNYEGRLNIFDPEKLVVTSYYGGNGEEVIIRFPPDYYVEVSGGYGNYKFKNILKLAETEENEEIILKETISQILGIPIDALSSQLALWDRWAIWQSRRQVKKSVKELDLARLPVYEEEILVDGSRIRKIAPSKVDFYLAEVFWERAVREENLKIAVFNGSDKEGLANKVARLLSNIGAKVVEVENFEGEENRCQVRTASQNLKKQTLKRLKAIFKNCHFEEGEIDPRFDLLIIMV